MSVTDSPSNRVETEPPEAVTGRWQLIIVAVAFVFPMIVLFIGGVLSAFFSGGAPQILLSDGPMPRPSPIQRPSIFVAFCMALLSCAFLDWPFFVLAYRVEPTFRKYWPDAKAAHAAITGGLIGISIPFVFSYAFVGVISAQSADGGVEGIVLVMPIVWLFAGWFASVGLQAGPRVVGSGEVRSQHVNRG
jgi:hypothetical protein